jgi:sigma-B regulation protein RsbU (phosphoserine phosphatase)
MPAAKRERRSTIVLYAALALLFLISATYRALDITERVGDLRHGTGYVRDPFDIDLPDWELEGVEPEAAAAGLQRGDTIRAINGNPVRPTGVDMWRPLRNARPGDRLTVDAVRGPDGSGGPVRAAIVLTPLREGPPSTSELISVSLVNLTLPLLCMLLGFWVAAVRVTDPRAWVLLFLMLSLGEFAGGHFRMLYGSESLFQPIAAAYQPILANLWPTAMLFFAIYFPERLALDRRYSWIKWILIAPILVRVIGLNPVYEFIATRDPEGALALHRALSPTGVYVGLSFPVFIALFFAIMGYRTVTETNADARRRLLLLNAGAAVSLAPGIALLIYALAVSNTGRTAAEASGDAAVIDWLIIPILGLLFIFPMTMAYVILVQRAMDVRVVVRQGVQYLLARGSIRVLQIAVSIAVFWMVMTMRPNRVMPFVDPAVQAGLVFAGVGAIVLIRRFTDRLGRWVDRRFFREAYDAERILTDLASRVRTMVETRPLLEMVAHQISTSLHVPRVAILLKGAGALAPAYAVGYADLPTVPLGDRGFGEDSERELKQELGAELVLPLSSNTEVIGVMGLGPKRSEAPFTPGDVRLLTAVAAQTGLALENSRLTAEIASEVALRERAQREIEIAREVQERLFPQDYPPIAGIEYAGACRPALGVGGDYYDFIKFSDTELGVAIGDVSGKGIPAALLMATLRAYLRGQTIRRDSDLAEMMANLNRLVYESSAPNRYATFFYSQYEANTRVLQYVNAGHNPPMIFKASGDVVRLDVGGPVIGLIEGCVYEQATVTLDPGDVLVAYTDGVSEAMNSDDEEWGEEQLAGTTLPARTLTCEELIARIMGAADGFVAGAPQHDDMTLVVLRQL